MKKILICDDSLFMRETLRGRLSGEYELIEADLEDGDLALFEKKPDVVLIDILLPEGESRGIAIVKKVKARFQAARVVMITAMAQGPFVNECHKLGADVVVCKPFQEAEVVAAIEKILQMPQ